MTGCIAGTNMGSKKGAAVQVDTPEDEPVVVGTAGHLSRRRRRLLGYRQSRKNDTVAAQAMVDLPDIGFRIRIKPR